MSVYFAEAGDYTKIGYSADPIGRVSTITRNGTRPDDLARLTDARLLGWIPGDHWREAEVQSRFVGKRVKGEWFRLSAEDVREIRDLIWSDPRGVDVQRMSAMAVLTCDKNPHATRAEVEAAGIRIEAATPDPRTPTPTTSRAGISQVQGSAGAA